MLSIENPPPDPPCPNENSQLKSSSSSDERASDKVAWQDVDLLNSELDDDNNNSYPLPKFSIRGYVFGARDKDIKNNWPFSQENLQLCLNHGVKELLPPFQPLDSIRNHSIRRCIVDTTLTEKENICNLDGDPSGGSDHLVSNPSDNAVDCVNIVPSESEGANKELPLTTDNQSHSGGVIAPADLIPCVALETNTLSEASEAKLERKDPPAAQKADSTNQFSVKKCRVIVKLGSGADPSSKEEPTGNFSTFSETMASKVCPVCKTFSSSSNTTLNAHIDQCLCVESTSKWTASSRVIKHRIKPRKTRLMVDIYKTAPHCTLEELDRRNGRSWAMNSCLPIQETMECAEEEKQRILPVNFKDKGDEGAVYIDANGTKLRILSKFNDTSVASKLDTDPDSRKILKGGRGSKLLSAYKKRHKHHKCLKLGPQRKKFSSSKPRRACEVHGDQGQNFALEENCRKMESLTRSFKAQVQNKPNDSGTIKKWACAKRTGLLKKRSHTEGLQDLGYNFTQKVPVESDQSSLGDSYVERRCIQKTPNRYECLLSSPDSSKRMDNLSFGAATNECNGQPSVRKRVGMTSFGSRIGGNMEKHDEAPKRNVRQLRKDGTSMEGSCKDFATYGENCIASLGKGPVEINACPVKNSSRDVCLNLSQNHCKFSSKATKFSSLRKHISVNQSSLPGSKYGLNRKFTSRKKSRSHCMAELDKKVVALDLKEKHAGNGSRIEEITGRVSLSRSSVLKVRKKRGAFSISQEQSMAMKSASECHSHEVDDDIDSSTRVGGDLENTFNAVEAGRKEIQANRDNIVMRPCSGMDIGGNAISSSKSLGPEFHNLANPSNASAGSFQLVEFKRSLSGAETPSCPTDSSLGDDEQDAFCVDEVGNRMIAQDTDMGGGTDANDGQGNYFTGLDPIPIPGPPGSFLPSPGGMGSEDLQGTSSLTTSRVNSSEDQHDLVERDSSDSPISATSTVSNSMIARSDTKSSEKLAVARHVTKDEIRSGFSGASRDVAENIVPASCTVTAQAERVNLDELEVKKVLPEKGPIGFRNDQPCCCSLKEGASQDVSLNSQESQLLRRRTMVLPVLPMRKELSCDPSRRPNCWNSMPEVIPLGNFRSSGSEKRVLPVTNLSRAPVSVKVSADSMLKSPSYGDYDSASPSASNPVLRLMGKNLMVVSRDETVTQQFRPAQSGSPIDHRNPQLQALSEVSSGNIQDENIHSFHHMGFQHRRISSQNQCNKDFEVKLSNCFGSHVASKTPQSSAACASSSGIFLSKNVGGGYYVPPFEPHKYNIGYSLPNDCDRARRNIPYTPFLCNVEKSTASGTQHRNVGSSSNLAKEVIVIDDTPERETDSAHDALYSDGTRETRVSSAGISIPMAGGYNSRHASPFCSYHPVQDSFPYHGSPLVQTAGFQMPPHSTNASPIKWNCTSDGSNVQPPTSVTASSSSTGRPRSSLYYSPSFT